ncbi:uncharacterized protein LOC128093341 [Culex pipiens pallens]|uniref:uncharacterized protein LOC128093341 n=1 Tax=Culex pipiens pallens TaxID=42434 RepID=UPI0022AA95E2|nr:uncharacterized protein LOC128093341 [Culex pipiens pallens]
MAFRRTLLSVAGGWPTVGIRKLTAVFQKFGQTGLKQRKVCSDHFSENELTSGLARRPVPGAVPRSRIQVASGQFLSNDDCRSGESRGIPTSVNWAEHETVDPRELDVPDKPSYQQTNSSSSKRQIKRCPR